MFGSLSQHQGLVYVVHTHPRRFVEAFLPVLRLVTLSMIRQSNLWDYPACGVGFSKS